MRVCSLFFGVVLCVTPALAAAAGFRLIDVPAGADGPALRAAVWYPCAEPPAEIDLGGITLRGVKDCPITGDRLPLVVISHGRGGTFIGHHDTAETLADAGFVVAALNHPGDTAFDMSRSHELSVFIDRPRDTKRLIDFMLTASPASGHIDPERIGFFGFSRGGYTGLVAVGAIPDGVNSELCQRVPAGACEEIGKNARSTAIHDSRVKAAVIADPLMVLFGAESFAAVNVPIQLWASEHGGDGVSPESVAAARKGLSTVDEYHVVPNAAHFAFLAPCLPALARELPEICTDRPGFDRVAFHRQFDVEVLAFFRKRLKAA
jgi:predicted dienelactone hydrolase